MNSDTIQGRWHEWKGGMKARWGRITDNEWMEASGDRERILGLLQQHYGYTREQAEDELDEFMAEQQDASSARFVGGAGAEATNNGVRAQPGDVIGIETDGETTELGDTAEDEDERRVDAHRTARENVEER